MAHHRISPLFCPLYPLLQSIRSETTATSILAFAHNAHSPSFMRYLSTTSTRLADAGGRGSAKSPRKKDQRITLIRYHLQHPKTPRPLRFSRMRALRHWTIHRAWMIFRRKKAAAEQLELQRFYQSMHAACEELRNLDPPDTKDAGRLFRIAMGKQGIYRPGGVPIEYARAQTETPGTEAWDHNWKR